MGTLIFLQVRMGSTRLPGKALLPLDGDTVLGVMVRRLKKVRNTSVVIVTGPARTNKPIIAEAKRLGVLYFCGSEENLLDRYYRAAVKYKPATIVRVTADCPLIDPQLLQEGITLFKRSHVDLLANNRPPSFPHGLDYEIFSPQILARFHRARRNEYESNRAFARASLNPTAGMESLQGFRMKQISYPKSLSKLRWTVDYPEDYRLVKSIFRGLKYKKDFDWKDVLRYVRAHPELSEINAKHVHVTRTAQNRS